jgi:hypothetical protein
MYVNRKMISVKTILRTGGDEEWWRGEFKYDIFDIL